MNGRFKPRLSTIYTLLLCCLAIVVILTNLVNATSAPPAPNTRIDSTLIATREPIDIVYYYVNGSDEDQIRLMQRMKGQPSMPAGSTKNRYREWGELRYSMRSLFKNAPWFRRIYLILRNNSTQVPHWLDVAAASRRLTIVTHEQIFPDRSHLPTLSSNAIESNIHRIPGLSRRIVLMNDDFFFFSPVSQEHLFPTATTHIVCLNALGEMPSHLRPLKAPSATQRCAERITGLLDANYGYRARREECHAPQPVDLTLWNAMRDMFPQEFEAASRAKFRSNTVCPRLFYNHWVLDSQPNNFAPTSRLWALRHALLVKLVRSTTLTRLQFILAKWLKPSYLGINDDVTEDATEEQIAAVAKINNEFLEQQFPWPSPLEKRSQICGATATC